MFSATHANDQDFMNCLNNHPLLKDRVQSLLTIVENTSSNIIKADDAEKQTIDEVRKLGNEVIHSWANKRIVTELDQIKASGKGLRNKGKKNKHGTLHLEI